MLKGHDIICISSIDWDFIWQGHQEIMSSFARNGNRVLFIENTGVRTPAFRDIPRLKKRLINWLKGAKGFREEVEGLFIYSPLILPFPYSAVARRVNKYLLLKPLKRWVKAMNFYAPIIWTFLPTQIALDIIDALAEKLLIYYCIANFQELSNNPKKISKIENRLTQRCDLVLAQGEAIADRCAQLNDNVHIFPFGVNIEVFENFKPSADNIPVDIKDIRKPIIGYVGGIHRHMDLGLIKFIARINPEWSIVLIGPIQRELSEIKGLPNIFLLGQKYFTALPNYINEFAVGIIPYNKSDYTTTVFPTKLNEYHAMGKPVVSTDIPEIVNFNSRNNDIVFIGRTYEEFGNSILNSIKNNDGHLKQRRIDSARENSWAVRIEQMSGLIEEAIDKKSKIRLNWRDNFLKIYQLTRRKTLRICGISLFAYFLLIYTPLFWFAANPLKISELPEKADCIVVLAGGVGESGKAGQGYEERVKYAVELYKREYARQMIFSSGYSYVFHEPMVMKALAVSLGVPENAVILDDQAANTYENIKFTADILYRKAWNKILLVSSPYHMRRVSLIAKKIAPRIKFIYTPIPESRFYRRPIGENCKGICKQITLEQIKALMHEYLGIIYYWRKGYI